MAGAESIRERLLRARQELEINPETIQGKYFRAPSVAGLGTGRGFELAHVHLPVGWQKALPDLRTIDPDSLQEACDRIFDARKLPKATIDFDPKSGLLKSVEVATDPVASLSLFTSRYSSTLSSEYTSANLTDLGVTLGLQEFVISQYLSRIGRPLGLSEHYGFIKSRASENLRIPAIPGARISSPKRYMDQVREKANNIAGRFGENVTRVSFDSNYRPDLIMLSPEADYHLDGDRYVPHNVADEYQATALHGIVAHAMNLLLDHNEPRDFTMKPRFNPNA